MPLNKETKNRNFFMKRQSKVTYNHFFFSLLTTLGKFTILFYNNEIFGHMYFVLPNQQNIFVTKKCMMMKMCNFYKDFFYVSILNFFVYKFVQV